MKVITAPEIYEVKDTDVTCFLAGGISNCPNWQKEVIGSFTEMDVNDLVIFNPRRKTFTPSIEEARRQIEWEYRYLNSIDIFSMYFCNESIQPICMYELGRYVEVMKRRFPNDFFQRIIISVEPDYERAFDVIEQVNLAYEEKSECLASNLSIYRTSYKRHAEKIARAYTYVKHFDGDMNGG